MKIGIDGILLRGRDAGSLRYFELLLEALAWAEQDHQYVIFAAQNVLESASIPQSDRFTFSKLLSQHILPGALRQQNYAHWHNQGQLDLLHTAVFVPPLKYPGKTLMTLFDLTFLRHPETQKWTGRLWWNLLGEPGIRKAERIITISQSTKNDLCQTMNVSPDKVDIIYPYTPDHFKPPAQRRLVADRYGLPEKYILYVGTLERRKNITALIKAYALAKKSARLEHYLVLVGQPGWLYNDVFRVMHSLDISQDVIFLGYAPEKDLPGLYSAADLFVYLSLYEGFGLPVLEAMACGAPVITSNSSSLPEVVGQAGVMTPPNDIEQAAEHIVRILADPELRAELSERGLKRAQLFSRQQFTASTLAVYERLLSPAPSLSSMPYEVSGQNIDLDLPSQTEPLRYVIPDGVAQRTDLPFPVLSTLQKGLVILDQPMMALWQKAHQESLPTVLNWASDHHLDLRVTLAALACLVRADLLAYQDIPAPTTTPGEEIKTSLPIEDAFQAENHPTSPISAVFPAMDISVVIVNYDSKNWLRACIESLKAQTHPPEEIIIVDNGSQDDSVVWIKSHYPNFRLIEIPAGNQHPRPLAHALNLGIQATKNAYCLLLNPDVEVDPNAIAEMAVAARSHPACAAVAAKLKFLWAPAFLNGLGNYVGAFSWGADNAIGHLDFGQFDHWKQLPSACFAAALINKDAYLHVGPIDEGFPLYYEDSEWCYRARLSSYTIIAAPKAIVYHALGRRIPSGPDEALSARKLKQVVFGRLRFVTKLAGWPTRLRLYVNYSLEDMLQFSLSLLGGRKDHSMAYMNAWRDFFASLPNLRTERSLVQSQRIFTDRALFSLQKNLPIALTQRGLPQLTWDIVRTIYLPLLDSGFSSALEFANQSIKSLPASAQAKLSGLSKQLSPWQRAQQIRRAEGAIALLHRIGRYVQWRISQLY
jgi:glycosyltransferase involved in cell wall biosynthesis/GT2 family glycosyltransferase